MKCVAEGEAVLLLGETDVLTYIASKSCDVRAPSTFGFFSILCYNLDRQPVEPLGNAVQMKHRPVQGP